MASAAVDPWPSAGTCWWVRPAPRSGAATGQRQAHVGSGGHPEWQGSAACGGWRTLTPLMNLDEIQLPLLLNSLSGLGVGRDEQREPE